MYICLLCQQKDHGSNNTPVMRMPNTQILGTRLFRKIAEYIDGTEKHDMSLEHIRK